MPVKYPKISKKNKLTDKVTLTVNVFTVLVVLPWSLIKKVKLEAREIRIATKTTMIIILYIRPIVMWNPVWIPLSD